MTSYPAHSHPRADLSAFWHRAEGPTWLVALGVYGGWMVLTWHHQTLPWWVVLPLGGWVLAWHGSLQHEILHGHPTRWQTVNTGLAVAPLALWLPYALYRSRHLEHHSTAHLTDPAADPESFYIDTERWQRLGPRRRRLWRFHNTLAGRLLVGPACTAFQFWREEGARLARGEPGCARMWAEHTASVALVLVWVVWVCGIPLWAYVLLYVYPGTALILLRSYHEHRPAAVASARTAIIEAGPLAGLLYLNNNLHALHHDQPGLAWYELPGAYRARRNEILARNRGLVFAGYGELARRFLWRPKDSPLHPGWASIAGGGDTHE